MLACIWGGDRYAWGSPAIIALIAGGAALAAALVARERRAPDPIVPLNLLRTRPVAVSSAALFLTTAALFSITVFVPLYLQTTIARHPDPGRAAARADDDRDHRVDEPRRPRDVEDRALQALPGPRSRIR